MCVSLTYKQREHKWEKIITTQTQHTTDTTEPEEDRGELVLEREAD